MCSCLSTCDKKKHIKYIFTSARKDVNGYFSSSTRHSVTILDLPFHHSYVLNSQLRYTTWRLYGSKVNMARSLTDNLVIGIFSRCVCLFVIFNFVRLRSRRSLSSACEHIYFVWLGENRRPFLCLSSVKYCIYLFIFFHGNLFSELI